MTTTRRNKSASAARAVEYAAETARQRAQAARAVAKASKATRRTNASQVDWRLMLPVALYCRVSTDHNGTVDSVANQESGGLKSCHHQWPGRAVIVFKDNKSGNKRDVRRPGFEAMLDAIRRGEVGDVVTKLQERLTRGNGGEDEDESELAGYERFRLVCLHAGITEFWVRLQSMHAVSLQKGQAAFGRFQALQDAEYSEVLSLRVRDGLDEVAARGGPSGGRSWGMINFVDERGRKALRPDDDLRDEAYDIARRIIAGESYATILADLNERGVPTTFGAPWSTNSLKSAMTSPTIAGLRVHQGQIIGDGDWPALIDRDTWNAVRAAMTKPTKYRKKQQPARRYLFTSEFAFCERCENPLGSHARSNKAKTKKSYAYACRSEGCYGVSLLATQLEEYVEADVLRFVNSTRFRRLVNKGDTHRAKRERLSNAAANQQAKITTASRRWANGELSDSEYWDALLPSLKARAVEIATELNALPRPAHSVDVDRLLASYEAMSLSEKRKLFELLKLRVVVKPADPGTKTFDESRLVITYDGKRFVG